mgnify:CR=1 FL=1
MALGLLAGEATRFSKIIGEQADNVRKGFDGLAEVGATAGDGMQGVFEGLQRLGLGVQDADHMVRLLAENAETVSLFGGTSKMSGAGGGAGVPSSAHQPRQCPGQAGPR